jgi:hypothetical protein
MANKSCRTGVVDTRVCHKCELHAPLPCQFHSTDRHNTVGANSQRSYIGFASDGERGSGSRRISRERISRISRHYPDRAFFDDLIDDDKTLVMNLPTVLAGDFHMSHSAAVGQEEKNVLRGAARSE